MPTPYDGNLSRRDPGRASRLISLGKFSAELGFHPGNVHEWWYVNSHLTSKSGEEFGVVVIFFQRRMVFMLSDKGELRVRKRYEKRGVLQSARNGMNARFGESHLVEAGRGSGRFELECLAEDAELSLEMFAVKAPVALNGNGRVREGVLGASWYYALTDLRAQGTLRLAGKDYPVEGRAWLDKQWGNWDFCGLGGWDWFSVQLGNACELLALVPFHPVTGQPTSRILTVVYQDSLVKTQRNFATRVTNKWSSPSGAFSYGSAWEIVAPGTKLEMHALFGDQEVHEGLWEGCCDVRGVFEGQPVSGEGYVEQLRRRPLAVPIHRAIFELWAAPFHYAGQRIFLRENFGLGRKLARVGSVIDRRSRAEERRS